MRQVLVEGSQVTDNGQGLQSCAQSVHILVAVGGCHLEAGGKVE